MIVKSSRFGEVEIDDKSVIAFPNGIPGFEDQHRFVMMRCQQTEPIQWMQSVDNEYIVVPVINPFLLREEYHIEVNDEELAVIETTEEEDIVVLCIMVLPENLQDMTMNLMAPIIINIKKMLGRQVVMDRGEMPLTFPAYEALMAYYQREEQPDAGIDEKAE